MVTFTAEWVWDPFSLIDIYTGHHNVTLTGGNIDIFDGKCDWKNGLHTHLPINVAFLPWR